MRQRLHIKNVQAEGEVFRLTTTRGKRKGALTLSRPRVKAQIKKKVAMQKSKE